MQPEELRIGNLVFDEYSGVMIVRNIISEQNVVDLSKTMELPLGRYDIGSIQCIPITVEFLNKLPEWFRVAIACGFMNYSTTGYNHYIEVKYVHHAQNLYFALTGLELPNE